MPSRIVAELKERLGGQLLQRTTRKLSLTEAGQAYYERCLLILEEVGVYAGYPVRRHLSGKVHALADYLSDAFRAEPWNTLAD